MPGCGETHGDASGDDLSSSTGEFLGDDEEEAFDVLEEIVEAEDLPQPNLDLLDDLSIRSSISFV